MAEESTEEKTEKPTSKKREETRNKGEVAKSKELSSVVVLFSGLFAMGTFGSFMLSNIHELMKGIFSNPTINDQSVTGVLEFIQQFIFSFLVIIGPLLAAVFIGAVLSNVMQVGFMFSGEPIKPKFSKLNPLKGLKRLVSMQSLMELAKSIVKLIIIGVTAYLTIIHEMDNVSMLGELGIGSIFQYIFSIVFRIFLRCSIAMAVLAVLDYGYQKWEFEKKLKMGKQEIKDEYKKTDGDPLVKSRIKTIQMEMARKRMMQAVPEADVIITNPTHFAVALKYDSLNMNAPKLVAKGAGEIAGRIKSLAAEHNVPVVENKELARNIYKLVEIGSEIPTELFQAVAEVLAYIYKLKGKYNK
ncbi:MAG: flagellar biosynthesis protein FlhB [Proteobacteria bacterium]|nr:flagellar biosynthesis protein FlhB [Pseudomonadota bacterium]